MTDLRGTRRVGMVALFVAAIVTVQHLAGAQSTRDTKFDSRVLERKLEEVLATQQTILQKLDELMEELRIIKVRATRS